MTVALKILVGNSRTRARRYQLPATLTVEEWTRTLADFKGLCAYCLERPMEEMDHFIPVSKGGGTTSGNCLPTCGQCNDRKGSEAPEGFLGADRALALRRYLSARSSGKDTGIPCLVPGAKVSVSLRVPPAWVTRLEKLAEVMSSPIEVTPTAALRYVVEKGLEAAESEYGIKSGTKKASK